MANYNRFYGYRLSDNSINYFDFNQPVEGKKNIVMWNKILNCFMYSQDAGLTWNRIYGRKAFDWTYDFTMKIDVVIPSIDELKEICDYEKREIKRLNLKGKKATRMLERLFEYQLLNTILDNVSL